MFIAWENSRHFALPLLVSPSNDVRETSLPRSGLCFWLAENLHHSIRSISQIWVVTRYQYGISALASQMSFRWETSGGVAKCRLFSRARVFIEVRCYTQAITQDSKPYPFTPRTDQSLSAKQLARYWCTVKEVSFEWTHHPQTQKLEPPCTAL